MNRRYDQGRGRWANGWRGVSMSVLAVLLGALVLGAAAVPAAQATAGADEPKPAEKPKAEEPKPEEPAPASPRPKPGEAPKAEEPKPAEPKPAEKPKPDEPKAEEPAPASPRPVEPKPELDPEMVKEIERLFEENGPGKVKINQGPEMTGRGARPATRREPRTSKPIEPRQAPATPVPVRTAAPARIIDPPKEAGDQSDLPPEERTYSFSIDGTYEDLLEGFSRQTGLGVLGDIPQGPVKFVSTDVMDFKEAIGRIRMLLFKYKPLEPYWLWYNDEHLEVIRVTDFYRILPREQMFQTVEEFYAAGLPDNELALVIYTPTSGSVADLEIVRDFMPDYVRIAPMDDMNAMTIFALVSDIKKYLGLVDFFTSADMTDPRTVTKIPCAYVLPSQALEKLKQLMDLDTESAPAAASRRRGAKAGGAAVLEGVAEPPVSVLPDDSQMVLIVRAMQNKIDEIEMLLAYIDVDPGDSIEDLTLIPVEHVDVTELVAQIERILATAAGPEGQPTPQPKRRAPRRGARAASGTPATAAGVTMVPVPASNSIAVMGDPEQVEQVRELVAMLDVSNQVGPLRLELEYADPVEVVATLQQVVDVAAAPRKGAPATVAALKLVADPSGSAIWVTGPQTDVDEVIALLDTLDVADDPVLLHVARLKYQKASFVANWLKLYVGETGGAAAAPAGGAKQPAQRGRRTARRSAGPMVAAAKFTPDDATGRLYVLCTDEEWDEYLPLINQLDEEARGSEQPVRLALKHIEPQDALLYFGEILEFVGSGPEGGPVRCVPMGSDLMVLGASDAELAQMRDLLAEIDQPDNLVQRTFEIRYADMGELVSAIHALFGDEQTRRQAMVNRRNQRSNKGGQPTPANPAAAASDTLSLVQVGDNLVVRTTPEKMEQVAALITEFDVEVKTTEMRVYDFPPGTDFENVVSTLSSVFRGGRPAPARQRGKGAAAVASNGPTFLPQPAARKLVIVADIDLFDEIEELLDVLRYQTDLTIETAFIPVEYAEVGDVVQQVEPLLRFKIQLLVQSGELEEAVAEGAQPAAPQQRGRRGANRAGASSGGFHLAADPRNSRVVIAAPQIVIDEATKLIREFDQPGSDAEPIVETVILHHTSAAEMVTTLQQMMGGQAAVAKNRQRRQGQPGAVVVGADVPLTMAQAPGGSAIVLRGVREDVEEAKMWIALVDQPDISGTTIEVYTVENADLRMLADLIMQVVDTTPAGPRGQQRPQRRGAGGDLDEDSTFDTSKKYMGNEVYIQADFIANTMVVSASQAKHAQIKELIQRFDKDEPLAPVQALPTMTYRLEHRDALDASFDLDTVLGVLWEPQDQLPLVDYLPFDDVLVIRYPDESRFAELEEIIRKHVDVIPGETKGDVRKRLAVPSGISAVEAARWFMLQNPDVEVELIDVGTVEDETYGMEQVKPKAPAGGSSGCALPAAVHGAVAQLLAESVALSERVADQPQPEPAVEPDPEEEEVEEEPEPDPDMVRAAVQSMLGDEAPVIIGVPAGPPTDPPAQGRSPERSGSRVIKGSKVKIYYDEREGGLIIEGPEGTVESIVESASDLEEEFKKFGIKPDIRVYRVRFIDVNTAAQIIDEVFNAAQREAARQAQAQARQAQMAARQAAAAQRRQQQQQGQQGGGRMPQIPGVTTGRGGNEDPRAAMLAAAQQQAQQAQQSSGVQIVPNPRDRTLIIRAATRDYPDILELLATIDQPQPIENEWRIIQLTKLNAAEVEDTLTDILGLDERSSSSGSRRRSGRNQTTGVSNAVGTGGMLPQRLTQQTEVGELGVFKDDIHLASDPVANTIIVSGPPAAIQLVEDWVKRLEAHDGPERVTKNYELKHADAEEIASFLETQFTEGQSARRRGRGQRGGATGGGAEMTRPTFLAYPRLNLLTVQALDEDLAEISEAISRLDVPDREGAQFETVTLAHADAKTVADTLGSMFGGQGGRGVRGRGGSGSGTGLATVFIGEEGGNVLFFKAPEALREEILATIEQIEAQYAERNSPRIIELEHAKPSSVAGTIEAAYGSGGRGGRRGGGRSGRLTVTADDPSMQLFVIADDELFAEIESLARKLDKPADMGFEFRIYKLQHASARQVYEVMSKLMTDYLRRQPRGSQVENFSVEVDDKSNALIVLGSAAVFEFLEKNLPLVDTVANAPSPPGFLMVALQNANAVEVAQNITRIWNQRALPPGETAPQAEANRSLNMLIVRGTQAQIDEIKEKIIDPMEEYTPPALKTETISLEYAQPEAVAESINRVFEDKKRAFQALGRSANVNPLEFTVVVTADVNTKQIVVQASEANMELVKKRVAELDQADIAAGGATRMEVYQIEYADPNAVVRIISEWARNKSLSAGRQRTVAARDMVSAVAEGGTQTVVVTASDSNHEIIKDLIAKLDDEKLAQRERTRHVITLENANADEIANQLNQAFRQVRRVRGDQGPGFLADGRTNSVVATVNDDELGEVQELLTLLDVVPTEEAERTMVVYPIRFADPNGIVNIINNTYRWQRRTQPRPGDLVVAVAEWATQSVIVTASAEKHEEIKKLIAEIDSGASGAAQTVTVQLEHAGADEVVQKLNEVVGRQRGRMRRAEQQMSIISNQRSNTVILRGTEQDVKDAQELIAVLDVPADVDTERQTIAYTLNYADPGSINSVILNMFRWDRRTPISPAEQVTCAVDWGTRSVIVTASEKNHAVVAKLLEQVDKETSGAKQMFTRELRWANADEVGRTLQQVYNGRRRNVRGEQPVQIYANSSSNTLLVYASGEEMDELNLLVDKLDVEPELDKERVMKVYPIKYADPNGIVNAINQNFRWQRNVQARPEDQVTASAEWATQTLIVTASTKNHEKIAKLVEELDKESTLETELHTVKLEHASSDDLARSLQNVYRGRSRSTRRGEQPVQFTSDSSTNALLITCKETEWPEIEKLAAELDVPPEAGRLRQIRSFALTYANPWNAQEAINSLFRGMSRNPRDQVTAVPEGGSNSVIVSASPENLERVAALINDLDQATTGQQQVHVVQIEHTDASSVARALDEIYVRSLPRQRGGEAAITIAELDGARAVLVKANAMDFERVMETIKELDSEDVTLGSTVEVVSLTNADAEEVVTALEEYLRKPGGSTGRRGRRGGGGSELVGDLRLSTLTQSNAIVISGDEEEVARVVEFARRLDDDAKDLNEPKLICLEHADAANLLSTLETMFEDSSRNRGRGRGGASTIAPVFAVEENLNCLLVRASAADMSAIEGAVALLDTPEAAEKELIRLIPVPMGINVTTLAESLESAFNESAQARNTGSSGRGGRGGSRESVSIQPDTRTHSLIVSGSPTLFDDVENAVKKLSEMGPPSGGRGVLMLRPKQMSAEQVQQLIEQLKDEGSSSSSSSRSRSNRGGRRR